VAVNRRANIALSIRTSSSSPSTSSFLPSTTSISSLLYNTYNFQTHFKLLPNHHLFNMSNPGNVIGGHKANLSNPSESNISPLKTLRRTFI